MTQGSNESINGIKTFTGDVVSNTNFNVSGLLNEVYLTDFYRDTIDTTDASSRQLTGNFTFLDNIIVEGNLDVSELVDGKW